jgi:hypothetical protein
MEKFLRRGVGSRRGDAMDKQIPIDHNAIADRDGNGVHDVLPDVVYKRLFLVNVVL